MFDTRHKASLLNLSRNHLKQLFQFVAEDVIWMFSVKLLAACLIKKKPFRITPLQNLFSGFDAAIQTP